MNASWSPTETTESVRFAARLCAFVQDLALPVPRTRPVPAGGTWIVWLWDGWLQPYSKGRFTGLKFGQLVAMAPDQRRVFSPQ